MRRALITGGSSGIGAAAARSLASAGFTVAVHYNAGRFRAESVVSGLSGTGHCAVGGDLADPAAVRSMLDAAVDRLGGVDVLVNNAGIYDLHEVDSLGYEEWQQVWRRTFEVNLFGAANLSWAFVDHLRHREESSAGARLIFVGSRGAYRGEPVAPAYAASKAGVHALAQSLALVLAPYGVAVSAVAPGFVHTEMTAAILDGPAGDAIRAQSPFGRVGDADEIAAAITWLASAEATWASGAVLDLNGASYLR
ncbi:MAG TPA: SDR family oxidoreductase [Amycolatopsis sp.]|nr:SDR family oxidoreductase [Amycolatopsis sp.]